MTEQELILFLKANWPNLTVGLICGAIYVRLSRFVNRLARVERVQNLMRKIHSERHQEDAIKLYEGDTNGE